MGGCIRDLLLRHAPKDFDIVTNARPQQIKRVFRNCRLIGRRFRLAHVYFGREIIEVATFRAAVNNKKLSKSKGGMITRDNVYGDLHEDAWRRDFTINALYYNISDCSIIDLTDGFQDLTHKVVRLIGDPVERYPEDPVRMLRAIRFAGKLDFQLAATTEKTLAQLAHTLSLVPAARLFDEMIKLYHTGKALVIQDMLRKYSLFKYLFPQTNQMLSSREPTKIAKFITITLNSTDTRIQEGKPVTPAFLLAAFLWYPFRDRFKALRQADVTRAAALHQAISLTISEQAQCMTIPKRLVHVIREIWLLQFSFPKRSGKRPFHTAAHPRFRAGYDFLMLLSEAGEQSDELITWWAEFKEAEQAEKEDMLAKLKQTRVKRQPVTNPVKS